jgi:hypothetical protein
MTLRPVLRYSKVITISLFRLLVSVRFTLDFVALRGMEEVNAKGMSEVYYNGNVMMDNNNSGGG